jgi:hypothetical protein
MCGERKSKTTNGLMSLPQEWHGFPTSSVRLGSQDAFLLSEQDDEK